MWFSKTNNKKNMLGNNQVSPPVSFYSLKIPLGDGSMLDCATLKGKKVLIVNTASDCGYTAQYDALQELYDRYNNRLHIIAFPANDFGEQEKQGDVEIAQFCKKNFGVTFPLALKSTVIEGPQQNPVFFWLTKKELNGWNSQQPVWNFSKYLVSETGVLLHYFAPSVAPMSTTVVNTIE
jgi:glutathione peroxidase